MGSCESLWILRLFGETQISLDKILGYGDRLLLFSDRKSNTMAQRLATIIFQN